MVAAFASIPLRDVDEIAFGDLFLEDIRAYRESRLAAVGKRGQFPLWGRDTHELAQRFLADGFRAIVVCVDPRLLDRSFAGREYDERLLADLPPNVDPCGENGEFHTFVYAGPIFGSPLGCRRGATIERDGFVFCDLLEQGA
jgi:diphthamide synthase (EF-2-diphthine--ammonia ligase)